MNTKANRNRLTAEVRALIRASAKATAELAAEYGVTERTIRACRARPDNEDRSSRPHKLRTAFTEEQELAIVALQIALPRPVRKLLPIVQRQVSSECSLSALYRCLVRRGLAGQSNPGKNVSERKDFSEPTPKSTSSRLTVCVPDADETGSYSYTSVSPRSPLTCPPKPGPGIMLEFLTKEDGIWPGKDEHQNRL